MSRYNVTCLHPEYDEAVVGWDNALQTFFATLYDSRDEEKCLFVCGADPTAPDVTNVGELARMCIPYCSIPENIQERLKYDYEHREHPSANQVQVKKFFKENWPKPH